MLGAFLFLIGTGASASELKMGAPAPNFQATASDGQSVQLKQAVGKAPIVLYFYPKDAAVGCSQEICSLKDNFSAFRRLKATVLSEFILVLQENFKILNSFG